MVDDFEQIVAGLGLEEEADRFIADTKSVKDMSGFELGETFQDTRQKLIEIGEMMVPRTDEGRELHSLRAACLIELKRRGLR